MPPETLPPPAAAAPPPRRRALARKLALSLATLVLLLGLAEGGARVVGWVASGFNPWYLRYGADVTTGAEEEGISDVHGGYRKYPPGRRIEFGLPEPTVINRHGFRGPEFEARKPAGTFRVVCLGASSTFGFKDRDAETWPALLQRQLQDLGGARAEAVNAGIPHADSAGLWAMFEGELVGYDPDAVVLYCGYNDAIFPMAESRLERLIRWLDRYSAAYAAVRKLGFEAMQQSNWWRYGADTRRADLELQVRLHVERYGANVRRILDLAEERGIHAVLVLQATTLRYHYEREGLPALEEGYGEACARIEGELDARDAVRGFEAHLLVHRALMDVLREEARARDLPLVDNITLVDERPEGLLTAVHLDGEANRRLAQAVCRALEPLVAGAGSGR